MKSGSILGLTSVDISDSISPKKEPCECCDMNIFTYFCRTGLAVFFAVTVVISFASVPHALGAGTPFVKEVAYYKDWKLTKPLSGTVGPGTTFFIKVVFSEPMRFKAADNNTARPILYYRLNGKLIRFRIAKHGAGGKDFVSGDGKPWHNGVDDYICKYTVPVDVMGEFAFAVGKRNTDRDGNTLAGFYTHKERLDLGQAAEVPSPAEITPPTVASINAAQEPQQPVAVDNMPLHGVNIPDPNLRFRIEAHLNKKPGDTITEADMRTLTVLSVANANIRDLTGLEHATNLVWLALYNNPLSADSVEIHLPALRDRGVVVDDILPSNGNGDGAESTDPMDGVDPTDPAPGEAPLRDEAFIFKKFLEQMLSDRKAIYALFDYDIETIFETPGNGFHYPHRGIFGGFYTQRPPSFHMLGIFVPDVLTTASTPQVNKFSTEYKLTREELVGLLRNLRRAGILVIPVIVVHIPDKNLREVVVAKINEQAALTSSQREVPEAFFIRVGGPKKPSDPIYEPEMRLIGSLKAEAAGIESLTGLEYAINLKNLYVGNPYGPTWDFMTVPLEKGTAAEPKYGYRVTKPKTPNQISDITPLQNLRKLEALDLGYNAISNLQPLAFLKNLRWLSLAENKITNIDPLRNLTNLTFLTLRNDYYSPQWAGNNAIWDLSPLENLKKLEALYVDHNPIRGRIEVVRSLTKLNNLSVGCCGVSNLRLFLEHPRLGQTGGTLYLVHSPLTAADVPDLEALAARGVQVEDGIFWHVTREGDFIAVEAVPYGRNRDDIVSKTFAKNNVEKCSVSHRESLRAAPTLRSQLQTEPDVLSSLWHDLSQVPEETALLPNYPNPFNPETWIPYQLAKSGEVTVRIYDVNGRLVRTLALGHQPAGIYRSRSRAAYWDGRNALGEKVASGVYFYQFETAEMSSMRKMVILQ